jgi:hypothetical protein
LEPVGLQVLSQFKAQTEKTAFSVRLPALGEVEAAETSTETQPVKTAVQAAAVDYLTVQQGRQVLAVKETRAARVRLTTPARAAAVQVRPVQMHQQLTAVVAATEVAAALMVQRQPERVAEAEARVQVEPVALEELAAVVKVVILELLILLQEPLTQAAAVAVGLLQFLEMEQREDLELSLLLTQILLQQQRLLI